MVCSIEKEKERMNEKYKTSELIEYLDILTGVMVMNTGDGTETEKEKGLNNEIKNRLLELEEIKEKENEQRK
jgi:phage-related protein